MISVRQATTRHQDVSVSPRKNDFVRTQMRTAPSSNWLTKSRESSRKTHSFCRFRSTFCLDFWFKNIGPLNSSIQQWASSSWQTLTGPQAYLHPTTSCYYERNSFSKFSYIPWEIQTVTGYHKEIRFCNETLMNVWNGVRDEEPSSLWVSFSRLNQSLLKDFILRTHTSTPLRIVYFFMGSKYQPSMTHSWKSQFFPVTTTVNLKVKKKKKRTSCRCWKDRFKIYSFIPSPDKRWLLFRKLTILQGRSFFLFF